MGGSAVAEICYPYEKKSIGYVIGQAIIWCVLFAMPAGALVAAGYAWVSAVVVPALYLGALGTILTIVFARTAYLLALRAYRCRHEAWWMRLSDSGFDINDRLLEPRRFDWRDIEDVVVVAETTHYEDGTSKIVEEVGLRYAPDHPKVNSRRRRSKGVDIIIEGPWGTSPTEAVTLLNSWRYPTGTSAAAAPGVDETPSTARPFVNEIPYPPDDGGNRKGFYLGPFIAGSALALLGWYVMTLKPAVGAGTGSTIALAGLAAIAFSCWGTYQSMLHARCIARYDWWLHASDDGFEINDRWSGPRRYYWRDIEDVVVAKVGIGEDHEVALHVGLRYAPKHLGIDPNARRKTGADLLIKGPWGRPPTEAVELLNRWRNSSA